MRSPWPTTTETLSRTRGRMSAERSPPALRISTACHSPARLAMTWRLPLAGQAGHDLADSRLFAAGVGVDVGEQRHLGLEGHRAQRILVGVEQPVGAGRGLGHDAGAAGLQSSPP
jgi:hypothetical protein